LVRTDDDVDKSLSSAMASELTPQTQPERNAIKSTVARYALAGVVSIVSPSIPVSAQTDSKGFLPVSLQCAAGQVQVLYQDPAGRRLRYEVQYSADEALVARAFVAKSAQSQYNLAARINFKKETVPSYLTLGREIVLKISWAKYACSSAAEQLRQEVIMTRNRAQLADP
jgi:hypothetical protein